ncbi:relaxase/mobilization nuclease domain-containing protein [Azospirillum sp. A1-3]|uniref:TraI/MobA(P) family conjugative relaxase n=1 Tax=Azospirillum sp. A1-3 TaxID=185874 RepID=UPI0020776AAB|nr:TraI/MobA(P) family conjugative relaxase [Azospirillum sp. A1-3]MCM8735504.1 relaxase/mobilization nuclease domain-containing protein [Azospirillum sp. A1-3]
MIAKRVKRTKATSDFARLGRYILAAKTEAAAQLWTRTADYILDAKGGGEKLAWSCITNCTSDEPGWAIREILVTQERNKRAKGDKTYHLIVSFPEGEVPTRAQLEDIEDTLCAGIGYAEHQRISAAHTNTQHFHIHIAINRVHPRTLRCVEPFYDHPTLFRLCRALEQKHGLQLHPMDGPTLPGRPGDMEAHSGEASFLRWVKETAGAELVEGAVKAASWGELHAVLERYGLVIRPKGAGLAIVQEAIGLGVKASSVDRSLSAKSLTKRLGAYEPSQAQNQRRPSVAASDGAQGDTPAQLGHGYQRVPLLRHGNSEGLYQEYKAQREALLKARAAQQAALRQAQAEHAKELAAWYAARRAEIKRSPVLTAVERRHAYTMLAHQRRADATARRQEQARQRQQVAGQGLPRWQDFLTAEASRGNEMAVAVLRSRSRRQRRMAETLLTAADADVARHIVYERLRPNAGKDGSLVYRVEDGGVVSDEATQVRVTEVTAGATFLALSLADDRFRGQALVVEGSDAFKTQVAQLAAVKGLEVRFADPELERERARMAKPMTQAEGSTSVTAFISRRNNRREIVTSIDYTRLWTPSDAGPVVYQGRRRLQDGAEVVLLHRGGETLVKPVTPAQAAKASTWRVGQTVELNSGGRLLSPSRGRKR